MSSLVPLNGGKHVRASAPDVYLCAGSLQQPVKPTLSIEAESESADEMVVSKLFLPCLPLARGVLADSLEGLSPSPRPGILSAVRRQPNASKYPYCLTNHHPDEESDPRADNLLRHSPHSRQRPLDARRASSNLRRRAQPKLGEQFLVLIFKTLCEFPARIASQ